jgi:hypothetical protein
LTSPIGTSSWAKTPLEKSFGNQIGAAVFKFKSSSGKFQMMKYSGKIVVCLVGALALTAGLRADDVVLPGNPYAPLVARNIFGLNPPIPVNPNEDATPPPKITPNGIMSIFGQLQVLFKVAVPARQGQPAKDQSYILSAGQRQDDIEVTQINEKAGIVTFNNHGTIQELPLIVGTPGSLPAATANPMTGYQPTSISNGNNFGGRNRYGSNFRNVPSRNPLAGQQTGMTPEEQVIAIEANREATKQQVIDGTMPPLPITEMTPSDAAGPGGGPLMTPTPP